MAAALQERRQADIAVIRWAEDQRRRETGEGWRLLSHTPKLRKLLFEVEEGTPPQTERLVGKVYATTKGQRTFETMQRLYGAGFCAPGPHRVSAPVAYWPERHVLLQGKAPGKPLSDGMEWSDPQLPGHCRRAAAWLAALHALPWEEPCVEQANERQVARWRAELAEALPQEASIIEQLAGVIHRELDRQEFQCHTPAHGDFHPMNIFLDEESVTVIDLDTFGGREPAMDVAYFLSQLAIMTYHRQHSFPVSQPWRTAFQDEYTRLGGTVPASRIGVYAAAAFLQSLHYDWCILKTGNREIVQPWLHAAERNLAGQDW